MSTKETYFLTDDNEHWYVEQCSVYNHGTKDDFALVLEIDSQHKIEDDGEGGKFIIIEKDTDLYKRILRIK